MAKILIVEDDETLVPLLDEWLKSEHHTVEICRDGRDARERIRAFEYDLIILDLRLPEVSGLDICKEFRACGGSTPILMLTGKDAIYEKTEGFDVGADDYLTKPFHFEELGARVKALLRRSTGIRTRVLKAKNVVVDVSARRVTRGNEEIFLQPLEFSLLEFFMRHPSQIFSPEALLRRVWASEADASLDAIYACIKRLRKKLDVEGEESLIRTVHGVGYRLDGN